VTSNSDIPSTITSQHPSRYPGLFGYDASTTSAASRFYFLGSPAGTNQTATELMSILNTGNVGINTTFPLQVLDVNGVMRLVPTDSPGDCNSTLKGSLYFDDSMSEPCFCNSTDWSQFDGGGACA
jgi:hypothetical protein